MLSRTIYRTPNLDDALTIVGLLRDRFPAAGVEISRDCNVTVIRAAGDVEKLEGFALGVSAGRQSMSVPEHVREAAMDRLLAEVQPAETLEERERACMEAIHGAGAGEMAS